MLRVFLLAVFLFGPAGALAPIFDGNARCEDTCPDDDERGQCAPDCDDCTCCAHSRPIAVAPSGLRLTAGGSEEAFEGDLLVPPTPYVGEILQVPKRSS